MLIYRLIDEIASRLAYFDSAFTIIKRRVGITARMHSTFSSNQIKRLRVPYYAASELFPRRKKKKEIIKEIFLTL